MNHPVGVPFLGAANVLIFDLATCDFDELEVVIQRLSIHKADKTVSSKEQTVLMRVTMAAMEVTVLVVIGHLEVEVALQATVATMRIRTMATTGRMSTTTMMAPLRAMLIVRRWSC